MQVFTRFLSFLYATTSSFFPPPHPLHPSSNNLTTYTTLFFSDKEAKHQKTNFVIKHLVTSLLYTLSASLIFFFLLLFIYL